MPIAHTCAHCGLNLSRVRAGLDSHLGLQVVVCPSCTTAVVRNRDRLRQALRGVGRLRAALANVAFRVAGTGALLLVCWGLTSALLDLHAHSPLKHVFLGALGDSTYQPDWEFFSAESGRTFVVASLLCGVVVGVWLCTAFRHLRLPIVAFAVFLVALLALPAAFIVADAAIRVINDSTPLVPMPGGLSRRASAISMSQSLLQTLPRSDFSAGPFVAPLVAFAGAPVGMLIARAINARLDARAETRRFSRLRAQLRRRRHAS